jgi:dienelactone hydrolase
VSYLERKIRRYEHKRWSSETNRRSLPFRWGLEHIGGRSNETDPRAFLREFVRQTIAASGAWFSCETPSNYESKPPSAAEAWNEELEFISPIHSPWPENNRVHARLISANRNKGGGPAVVVLPQWNAAYSVHVDLCRWLNRLGITALRLSLPYHDKRSVPGHERADHIVGPNIGLTLQANRQAVCDARCCLRWLAMRGYGPLGILGASLGSCISCITASHEPLIRAAALLHVSSYFGDVVANGLTTIHVWESMRPNVSDEEIREYWSPISPLPYISKLRGTGQKLLAISGRYDPTFPNEFSEDFFAAVRSHHVDCRVVRLSCGHYSLGEAPFKWIAGWRFGKFLQRALRLGTA